VELPETINAIRDEAALRRLVIRVVKARTAETAVRAIERASTQE